jgi:hypothetical protein
LVARLAGLGPRDQALLACGVFEMVWDTFRQFGRVRVRFCLSDSALQARIDCPARPGTDTRLELSLPAQAGVAREDLAFLVQQVDCLTPLDCFEEMRQQNLDLLNALADLHRLQDAPVRPVAQPPDTAAA